MDSSLKISLKVSKLSSIQPTKATSHKVTKRRIESDDESNETFSPQAETSLQKSLSKRPRFSYANEIEPEQDAQLSRSQSSKSTVATAPKPRVAAGVAKKPLKRKKAILSDDEDADNDEEFVPEPEEKPTMGGTKPKNKDMKGRKSGTGGGAAIGKIIAKNESMSASPSASNTSGIDKRRGRKEDHGAKEEDMEVDVTSIHPTPSASIPAPLADVDPPRKKLPTIKKKTKPESAAKSTSMYSPAPLSKTLANAAGKSTGPGIAKPRPPAVPGPSKKPAAPVQATTMNPSGSGDFDLRDMNTWASLIGKGTSSSGPRVGIEKRVSTEERRKQLDKMRNEARLRREEQYRHTFDLQAQSQKIAIFERRFASHSVRIPGPNVLGAAFKARPIPRN